MVAARLQLQASHVGVCLGSFNMSSKRTTAYHNYFTNPNITVTHYKNQRVCSLLTFF
jgi:hypothetical protein